MEYRGLGGAGEHPLPGTMMFGAWGNADVNECVRITHAALDAGINFVDTADIYSNGESEEIVGPRTLDQLEDLLAAADLRLDDAILDAIDELVPPGTVVDEHDRGFEPRWLEPSARRRA